MIDRVVRRVERLPGGGVPWIVAVALGLVLLCHVPSWVTGEIPVGTLVADAFVPVSFMAFFLGLIDVLDRIARSSFAEFRVALAAEADDADRLADALTSIPGRRAIGAMVVLSIVIFVGFALFPGSAGGGAALPPTLDGLINVLWFPTGLALSLVAVHTIQQLRLVGRLHAMAAHVDLLQPGPTHALSRLTAATAVGILVIGILLAAPESTGFSAFGLVAGIAFWGLAIASFGLPLAGMHSRLAAEKARLLGDVNSRLTVVQSRIHHAVDIDDLGRADELQKTQAALLAERDLYARVSTWPWSSGTFRGLASAVLLPVIIGLALRLVARYV